MTKIRALLVGLAVLVLLAFTAGCGLVSDQAKQGAKKKIEAKGQQAKQEAMKKVEAKKQEVKKKLEAGQDDLKKKVDDLQKKVDDVQKKVNELLKKVDAQEQQDQKKEK